MYFFNSTTFHRLRQKLGQIFAGFPEELKTGKKIFWDFLTFSRSSSLERWWRVDAWGNMKLKSLLNLNLECVIVFLPFEKRWRNCEVWIFRILAFSFRNWRSLLNLEYVIVILIFSVFCPLKINDGEIAKSKSFVFVICLACPFSKFSILLNSV